jgi:hypothetical protein
MHFINPTGNPERPRNASEAKIASLQRPKRRRSMMRTLIVMTSVGLLLTGGAALAQSGQGGYLGLNPGKNLESASQDPVKPPPVEGSRQGGYLGENFGKNLESASQDPIKPPPVEGSHEGGYLGLIPGGDASASNR